MEEFLYGATFHLAVAGDHRGRPRPTPSSCRGMRGARSELERAGHDAGRGGVAWWSPVISAASSASRRARSTSCASSARSGRRRSPTGCARRGATTPGGRSCAASTRDAVRWTRPWRSTPRSTCRPARSRSCGRPSLLGVGERHLPHLTRLRRRRKSRLTSKRGPRRDARGRGPSEAAEDSEPSRLDPSSRGRRRPVRGGFVGRGFVAGASNAWAKAKPRQAVATSSVWASAASSPGLRHRTTRCSASTSSVMVAPSTICPDSSARPIRVSTSRWI